MPALEVAVRTYYCCFQPDLRSRGWEGGWEGGRKCGREGGCCTQSNLKALFKGKVEAVELPQKRPVGRPKGSTKAAVVEVPDSLAEEVRALKRQRTSELSREIAQLVRKREASLESVPLRDSDVPAELCEDSMTLVAAAAAESSVNKRPSREAFVEYGQLGATFGRLGGRPKKERAGKSIRKDDFGPQAKLRLCLLVEKTVKETGEDTQAVVASLARTLGRPAAQISKAIEGKAKREAIVVASGGRGALAVSNEEQHTPKYLRTRRWGRRGEILRAPGAGRKSDVEFLYPVVASWFEDRRAVRIFLSAGRPACRTGG